MQLHSFLNAMERWAFFNFTLARALRILCTVVLLLHWLACIFWRLSRVDGSEHYAVRHPPALTRIAAGNKPPRIAPGSTPPRASTQHPHTTRLFLTAFGPLPRPAGYAVAHGRRRGRQ